MRAWMPAGQLLAVYISQSRPSTSSEADTCMVLPITYYPHTVSSHITAS
jgi:hypothetical protein